MQIIYEGQKGKRMREFIKNLSEAEYKKHMEHYNAAANAFSKIVKIAAMIDDTKLDYQKKKSAISADTTISDSFRAKRLAEIHTDALTALAGAWAVVERAIPVFETEVLEIAERIDLRDSRLATAVSLATAVGAKEMPAGSQKALVEPFAGNLEALNILHPVVKNAGMGAASTLIDGYKADMEKANGFAERAAETLRAATLEVEGDYTQFVLAAYAQAVAKVYDFEKPELPAELQEAAVRKAMGLEL